MHRPRDVADLGVEDVLMDGVFHAQHLHIGSQRHLPHAVGVEVKLVLHKIIKVLHRRQQNLQRLRKDSLSVNTLLQAFLNLTTIPIQMWGRRFLMWAIAACSALAFQATYARDLFYNSIFFVKLP